MEVLEKGEDRVYTVSCSGGCGAASLVSLPCNAKLSVSSSDIYTITESIYDEFGRRTHSFNVFCCPVCSTETHVSGYGLGNVLPRGHRPSEEKRKALYLKYLESRGLLETMKKMGHLQRAGYLPWD